MEWGGGHCVHFMAIMLGARWLAGLPSGPTRCCCGPAPACLQPECDNWCAYPVSDRANAVRQFLEAARADASLIKVCSLWGGPQGSCSTAVCVRACEGVGLGPQRATNRQELLWRQLLGATHSLGQSKGMI